MSDRHRVATAAVSATRVRGANDRIHVGLIGIGGRGTAHLNSYVKIPDCQVAALCDVNQAARERAQCVFADVAGPYDFRLAQLVQVADEVRAPVPEPDDGHPHGLPAAIVVDAHAVAVDLSN